MVSSTSFFREIVTSPNLRQSHISQLLSTTTRDPGVDSNKGIAKEPWSVGQIIQPPPGPPDHHETQLSFSESMCQTTCKAAMLQFEGPDSDRGHPTFWPKLTFSGFLGNTSTFLSWRESF